MLRIEPASASSGLLDTASRDDPSIRTPKHPRHLLTLPVDLLTAAQPASPSLPTLPTFAASLDSLLALLDQASEYVAAVQAGKVEGNDEVGRYLLEAVGRWSAGAGAAEEEEGEGGVKKGVQDTLSVSYLASLLRMQVELQGRLGLVQQVQQTA